MGLNEILGGMSPSVSGLRAERLRMEVVAANIANSEATKAGPGGEPYRRRTVQFAPALDHVLAHGAQPGVKVTGVGEDPTPFPVVYRPGHPDADEKGFVTLPNVNLAFEMVDLASSTRAYEANLSALKAYREMADRALQIGK